MILRLFDYDSIDKREIKFGFYMALHHPFDHRGKFAFGMIKYSLRIIMRKLCVCECPNGLIVDRDTNCPCECHGLKPSGYSDSYYGRKLK